MPVELVVYDLDGTLVDSAPATVALLNQLRNELGLSPLPYDAFIPWLSLGGVKIMSNALELDSDQTAKEYLEEFRRRLASLPSETMPLYPNVKESLQLLFASGIKMGICTNKANRLVHKIIKELRIADYFDVVIAGDDLPVSKPNPVHLLTCLERLNVSIKDAIFVGDSTVDQRTAESADVPFAFYQKGYNDGVNEIASMPFNDHLDLVKRIIKYE
jgi:phosphoglycolate phosphatase